MAKTIISLETEFLFKAPHTITRLNSAEWFKIYEMQIDRDRIWIRGEDTRWFNIDKCERKTLDEIKQLEYLTSCPE